MKKLNLLVIGVALALPSVARATIIGSPHDLSQKSWNTRQGVCSPCHAAHHTDTNQIAPLWVHATTTASFTPYSGNENGTMDASVGQPNGASKACLSCHDGTVALNQGINGQIGSSTAPLEYIAEEGNLGTDIHTTHPISFIYNSALASVDGGLNDPATYHIGDVPNLYGTTNEVAPVPTNGWSGVSLSGRLLSEALLDGQSRMQCSSCHDVHKNIGSSPTSGIMIKVSGNDSQSRGSLICRTCHLK